MYRVTRGGQDIYSGQLDGLLEAAREGKVLANDLIFDSSIEKWVFARSLPVLTGFPLKGRRSSAPADDLMPQIGLSEASLLKRAQRRRRLSQLLALGLIAVSASLLIWLVPNEGSQPKNDLKKYVKQASQDTVKFEGTGAGFEKGASGGTGRSNMDNKDVQLNAERTEGDLEQRAGRKATLAQPPGPTEGTESEPGDGVGQGSGSPGIGGEYSDTRAGEGTEGRNLVRLPEPKSTPPEGGGADGDESRGNTVIQPDGKTSIEDAKRELATAQETLRTDASKHEESSMEELLAARARAEFAAARLRLTKGDRTPVKEADDVIKKLTKAFLGVCTRVYSEKYCQHKSKYPDWPDAVLKSVVKEDVLVGMTLAQLELAWGRPQMVTKGARGAVHCYGELCGRSARVMGGVVVEVKRGTD